MTLNGDIEVRRCDERVGLPAAAARASLGMEDARRSDGEGPCSGSARTTTPRAPPHVPQGRRSRAA